MTEQSIILHVDMDAFYASIEQRDRPELRGKPVIVGSPPDQRGVVSAASYEARVFGVHSAMPSRTAGARCPGGIFVPVDMAKYQGVSREVMTILGSFTPLVEQISVDEAFLDVTGAAEAQADRHGFALRIKQAIRDQLALTASIGVAPNKYLAKLASDMDKPDGLTMVPTDPDEILTWLAPLPVGKIWGVGKKTEARLLGLSIRTMGDLQQISATTIGDLLGSKAAGAHLWALACGLDDRVVVTHHNPKSISNEHTFDEDCDDPDELRRVLILLTEKVGRRLREAGLVASTGGIKVRVSDFTTVSRQQTFAEPTDLDHDLLTCSRSLFDGVKRTQPVRLLGFGVSGLVDPAAGIRSEQTWLFEDEEAGHRDREKQHRLDEAVDTLRSKFGTRSVRRGG